MLTPDTISYREFFYAPGGILPSRRIVFLRSDASDVCMEGIAWDSAGVDS